MLGIFGRSFRIATRNDRWNAPAYWHEDRRLADEIRRVRR